MNFPEMKKRETTGGKFLKLVSKAPPVKGVIQGDPYLFESHYLGQGQRSQECTGEGCLNCGKVGRPSEKFRVNFLMTENGVYVSKIFEGNYKSYNDLRAMLDAGLDLSATVLQLSKSGEGKQTVVSIIPLGQLNEKQLEQIRQVSLHPLNSTTRTTTPDDSVPF